MSARVKSKSKNLRGIENMEKTIEELKQEADELGITYSPNIGVAKLAAKIEEWYAKESAENSTPVQVIEETKEEATSRVASSKVDALRVIKQQERKNLESTVVKISCVDKREASVATHAYFSTGDVGMNIPLDVFVEIPKILVYLAETARALVHVEQNGETVSKLQKKYVVEYKD